MAKKIVIANWKMNPASPKEAESLALKITRANFFRTEVVLCPPFVYLEKIKKISRRFALGAQDVFYQERGAFTGEISAEMLANLGVKYVLVGHSERRKLGESNEEVNKKIKVALFFGLKPILCVGETERDEEHGYFSLVREQIRECLAGIKKELLAKIIVAYEPVWALSTTIGRRNAVPTDSREMSIFIKKVLADKFGMKTKMPRIIYGGSVNPQNVFEFMESGGVDGVLPGAASLNPKKFLEIINIVEQAS
jgi:triosephosphate isomerase